MIAEDIEREYILSRVKDSGVALPDRKERMDLMARLEQAAPELASLESKQEALAAEYQARAAQIQKQREALMPSIKNAQYFHDGGDRACGGKFGIYLDRRSAYCVVCDVIYTPRQP